MARDRAGKAGWDRDRDGRGSPPPRRPRQDETPEERPRGTRGLRPLDNPPEAKAAEVWIDEGPVRAAAGAAVGRAREDGEPVVEKVRRKRTPKLPEEVVGELVDSAGSRRAERLAERLDSARKAFDRDRYTDAKRIVSTIAHEAPRAASVRELHGLVLYRMDRWKEAIAELEAFRSLTASTEQNPVLADCYRAIKRYDRADALWEELKEASPSAELMAEGRIVAAGTLADRGKLSDAVALLEKAPPAKGKVRFHHLRQWYALADLYDRAGDASRARRLFERVAGEDPAFADVLERLRRPRPLSRAPGANDAGAGRPLR